MSVRLLGTTVPGLESMAIDEAQELIGCRGEFHHPGAIQIHAPKDAIVDLNQWSRQLHRVLVVVGDGSIDTLQDAYEIAADVPIEQYVSSGQTFGVRCSRHGEHPFTSVDVAERIGQAIVDRTAEQFNQRLPVNLDVPEVIVRAYVRGDRLLITLDTTGERSLHKRTWRECEHNAPLRPTIAHAMLRLAEYEPMESLVDPMCGGGTIPIEAAGISLGRKPLTAPDGYAYERLTLSIQPTIDNRPGTAPEEVDITGYDANSRWIRCGRVNVRAAGLTDIVSIEKGDATELVPSADIIAVDLPFGIRTSENLPVLYRKFAAQLKSSHWDRCVAITTRPDLLPLSVTNTVDITYGRLNASIVVIE